MRLVQAVMTAVAVAAVAPVAAGEDLREPVTGTVFPGAVTLDDAELTPIGVGLREATIMKLNVYAIASYVASGTDLGEDPGPALIRIETPKQLRLVFVRDMEGEKMRAACTDAIRRNFGSKTEEFAGDLDTFLSYLPAKFASGDRLNLSYVPGAGVWADHNDDRTGAIANPALMRALWTMWFGDHPVSDPLKRSLLGVKD